MFYENRGWISVVDMTVEELESLLQAEYHEHGNSQSSKVRLGTHKYHVPEHLASHIDYINPGIKLSPVIKRTMEKKLKRSNRSVHVPALVSTRANKGSESLAISDAAAALPPALQDCAYVMTPYCIRTLYSIPETPEPVDGNSLGVFAQGSYFLKPISTTASESNGAEAILDIQIATSLVYPQTVTLYQVDDDIYGPGQVAVYSTPSWMPSMDHTAAIAQMAILVTSQTSIQSTRTTLPVASRDKDSVTKVISISYGQAEADLPAPYTRRQCNEFMKLGLQGVSILIASGDNGVATFPEDGPTCLGPQQTIFNPGYPNGCPYVTVVGATQLPSDGTVYDAEVVMQADYEGRLPDTSSAGGFSNYFSRPRYQDGHVQAYFHRANITYPYYSELNFNANTTTGIYNRIGRAYPDVSAIGSNFPL
ncbi:related to serine protease [Rhynchosporium secalis]|uniref:Related to serine protease n=1 Tax=Rhynchosporium secalis TaxID=38038 RepID=A0A1E1MLJ9_RHYSE|nr:related to serine protease [Rhynchosporium secalis]